MFALRPPRPGEGNLKRGWAERCLDRVVDHLQAGKVCGWYHGRFEWGPRALGSRSIIADVTPDGVERTKGYTWMQTVSGTFGVGAYAIGAIFDNYVATIVGELAIPTADITVREIPETAQKASSDAIVHRADGGEPAQRRRIDLHLRTSLGDDVQLTGFGLTTGLEGAVQLRGGTHAPFTGQGRLGLVDGRYEAYGQELEIERGSLIFTGPLDEPLLDIAYELERQR